MLRSNSNSLRNPVVSRKRKAVEGFAEKESFKPFFFFFSTDYIIPQTFTVTSSIGCFYFLVFLFYNF